VRYETEVMLGATDESHIIRTLEYWDKESRRYLDKDHRAVIVAEEITNRFFNVIWLLNRSIPIIAIQLNALECDGKLILTDLSGKNGRRRARLKPSTPPWNCCMRRA